MQKHRIQRGIRFVAALGMALTGLWQAAAPAQTAQAASQAAAPAQAARPAAVVTRAKVKSLSKGNYYTTNQCAVLVDGQVLCWGNNGSLELSSVSGVVSVPLTMTGVSDALDVSGGDDNWCVLHEDHTVSCVGRNGDGQLGNGTEDDTTTLSPVVEYLGGPPMGGIKQISTGPDHRCAVMNDGAVRCWGKGTNGRLGNGATVNMSVPVTVTGIVSAVYAATMDEASCAALADGSVQCWGKNTYLGAGATVNMSVPVTVLASAGGAPLSGVVELEGSYKHVCALTSSGLQYCWGSPQVPWSGNGANGDSYPVRAQRIEDQVELTTVKDIVTTDYSACAALEDGTVRCWGGNYDGEVGVGDKLAYSRAVTVTLDTGGVLTDVVGLGNARSSVCALTGAGNVYCWGAGDEGTLGNGTVTESTQATLVIAMPLASTDAALSGLEINPGTLWPPFDSTRYTYNPIVPNTVASMLVTPTLRDANATYTITGPPGACSPATSPANCALSVGVNTITVTVTAQDGATVKNYVLNVERLGLPVVTTASVKSLSRSTYSGSNQCAILTDGRVLCWGDNIYGQVSSVGGTFVTVPVTVTGVTNAVDVSVGSFSYCIVHADETASCVGFNYGQLGNSAVPVNESSAVLTPVVEYLGGPPMRGIKQMDIGDSHTCAAMTNGTVRCWGEMYNGALGNGAKAPSLDPVTVTGVTSAVQVAVTYFGSCALLASGNVQCWGDKNILGIGATAHVSVPVTVLASAGGAPLGGIVELRSTGSYVCGRTAAGEQYCWGANANSSSFFAGNGTDTDEAAAYPVRAQRIEDKSDLSGVAHIAPTTRANCAVMADGTVRCWGLNTNGQAGVGDTNAYTRAVTVTLDTGGVLTGVVDMGYSEETVCALTSFGNVYCWGKGSDGMIGNGVKLDSTRATLVIVPPASAAASNDASLGGLEIHPGTLSPAFVSTTTSYAASVPNGTTSAVVTATTSDVSATVAYSSSAGACTPNDASPSDCAVAGPKTWITVTVTAADGTTTEQYYIEITVADANASTDASLMDLTIDPGTLNPAFVSSTTSYKAGVPNGTTATDVTATPSDANATVTYESSAGECAAPNARNAAAAPANCAVAGPKTWITVTVTAEDGTTTEKYYIEITVAAALTTIDRVWPGTGLPAGGMPVQIFGSGFVAALTVTVGPYTDGLMIDVLFDPVSDKQIDFVMPAGVAGQRISVTVATADDAQTAPNAFTYVEPEGIQFDGLAGGVFTTTDGVVVTIPPQGVSGMFVITMTPLPPAPGVPGNILMYSFRLDALLNWVPLASLTNPVTIKLPIDENIFAIADGERPWLYSWTGDGRRLTAAETTDDGGRRSAVGGRWVLVRGQEYDPGTRLMTVALRPMGVYALSTAYLRAYWFPVVPTLR